LQLESPSPACPPGPVGARAIAALHYGRNASTSPQLSPPFGGGYQHHFPLYGNSISPIGHLRNATAQSIGSFSKHPSLKYLLHFDLIRSIQKYFSKVPAINIQI
jgi:hypothetical protein